MIVYLNGKFQPIEDAHIPVLDRGFIFGDGVYEVIPVYNGKLLRLEQHISRLERNLREIKIPVTVTTSQWSEILHALIEKNPGQVAIYIQITRGVAPREHSLPENVIPTVLAMCNPVTQVSPDVLSNGVSVITCEDFRWKNCHIKTTSLLGNVLLKQQAVDAGAAEAVLIRDGNVTEGSATNVFIVSDGLLMTPPKGPYLLPGVTRDLVLELAQIHNVQYKEQVFTESVMLKADEVWLTSSTKDVVAVTRINGNKVGDGTPGPLWKKMYVYFQEYKKSV